MDEMIEPVVNEREERHARALVERGVPIQPLWYGDNFLVTALFNASSVGIPLGEELVIKAARDARPHVEVVLQKEIDDLIHEETAHIRVHEAYNTYLRRTGFPVEKTQRSLRRLLSYIERHSSLRTRLAIAAAFEHFTAISAKQILENGLVEGEDIDERLDRIWTWHALEELDHRNATFDVYRAMGGGYARRIWGAAVALLLFIYAHYRCFFAYLYGTQTLFKWRVWKKGLPRLFGRRGIYGHFFTNWLKYFKPGFHPSSIPIENRLKKQLHHYHIESQLIEYFN